MKIFLSETDLVNSVRAAFSSGPIRLFRNQVGQYQLIDGRFLRSGLCVGSGDLIGWRTVEITPDMVGKKIAQFVSLEGKSLKGRLAPEQLNFNDAVQRAGGCAGVFRSVEDVSKILSLSNQRL